MARGRQQPPSCLVPRSSRARREGGGARLAASPLWARGRCLQGNSLSWARWSAAEGARPPPFPRAALPARRLACPSGVPGNEGRAGARAGRGSCGFRFRPAGGTMPLHRVPPRLWEAVRRQRGIYARLPEHYLRALREDEATPPPAVHWRPQERPRELDPATWRRRRVQDAPVPVYHPPESQEALWGGEGWVFGYRYANNDKLSPRLKKVWKPQLFYREFYSEILDRRLTIEVTMRTLDLVDAAFGFDFYILKTPKVELCSKLGMDLKRTMLLRLARRDPALHPDDPARREAVYEKYKEFVLPEEEAEWVGLSLEEAVEKQRLREKKDPVPLFKVYVEELMQQLEEQKLSQPAKEQRN